MKTAHNSSPIRHLIAALVIFAVMLALPRSALAALRVVATVPTLAAIAKEIGGDRVEVSSLSLHTQDPHWVDAKPSLALALSKADLLLVVGLGLEVGWLPTLQKGARNAAVNTGGDGYLDCSAFVAVLEKADDVDRSGGDIHPGGNPHYLYDPRRLAHVATGMTARLAKLDPAGAGAFHANLDKFLEKLKAARTKIEERMRKQRGKSLVAYHKSWAYLTDWLGLVTVAHLEPKPGIPPSPAHVARVLAAARSNGARAVVQESYFPNATGKLVAQKSGASLVVLPGGADFEHGQSPIALIESMAARLDEGLGK